MKIFFSAILMSILLLSSCTDSSVDPERSIGGEMTATINGQSWISQKVSVGKHSAKDSLGIRIDSAVHLGDSGRIFLLLGSRYKDPQHTEIVIFLNEIYRTGTFKLGECSHFVPGSCYAYYQSHKGAGEFFYTQQDTDGEVTITRWDNEVIEGTFNYVATSEDGKEKTSIENGKFKVLLNEQ